MILATVGAQMPFDRLIRAIDAWAADHPQTEVFAQIGPTGWRPPHIRWTEFISPAEFRHHVSNAQAVVSHAGMGTIITALEFGRPLLVMPRRGDLRETRNDHQVATARRFRDLGRVFVAFDEYELPGQLTLLLRQHANGRIHTAATPELIGALREFILGPATPGGIEVAQPGE